MGLLNWLIGRPKELPWHPPTEKQLNYARKLRLQIPPDASRAEVSAMLSDAEHANPKLRGEREQAKERQRAKKFGAELIAQEKQWQQLADQDKWLAAVHKSGKSVKVDLLRINGAYINDKGKLRIETEAGKAINDGDLGPIVDIGRYVEPDPANLLWSQIVGDIDLEDVARFKQTLAQTEKMAAKLK